jgi:hypothetical protein
MQKKLFKIFLFITALMFLAATASARVIYIDLGNSEEAISITQEDYGYVLFGQHRNTNEIFAITFDKNLDLLKINSIGERFLDRLNVVEKTPDNRFFLSGNKLLLDQAKIAILELNSYFVVLNYLILPVSGADQWVESALLTDDGYILAGGHRSIGGNWYDALLIKCDNSGKIIWSKKFGGSSDEWFSKIIDGGDGYLCVGSTESYTKGMADFLVTFFSRTGKLIWWKTAGGEKWDRAISATMVNDGFLILGLSNSFTDYNSPLLLKTDKSGKIIWQKVLDLKTEFFPKGLIEFQENLYCVYGNIWNGENRFDVIFIFLDQNGDLVFKKVIEEKNDQNINSSIIISKNEIIGTGSSDNISKDIFLIFLELKE